MKFADERHADTFLASHGPGSRAASLSTRRDRDSDGDGDGDEPAHDCGPVCCTTAELGSMSFMRVQGPAQEACLRAMQAIREGRRFPLQLLVIRHGSLTADDPSGSSVTLGPDDMALIEGGGTTELLSLQFVDAWIIGLAEPLIARWLQGLPTVTAQRLHGDRGWAKVLSAYLRNWELEPLRGLISSFEKEIIGEHVMSLLAMALAQSCATCDAPRISTRDRGLYTRMHQWIRDNYSNPDIGVATLADRFGVSTRYVHKVFLNAGQGQTFLDAVRLARLEAAAQWLQSSRQDADTGVGHRGSLRLLRPRVLRSGLSQEVRQLAERVRQEIRPSSGTRGALHHAGLTRPSPSGATRPYWRVVAQEAMRCQVDDMKCAAILRSCARWRRRITDSSASATAPAVVSPPIERMRRSSAISSRSSGRRRAKRTSSRPIMAKAPRGSAGARRAGKNRAPPVATKWQREEIGRERRAKWAAGHHARRRGGEKWRSGRVPCDQLCVLSYRLASKNITLKLTNMARAGDIEAGMRAKPDARIALASLAPGPTGGNRRPESVVRITRIVPRGRLALLSTGPGAMTIKKQFMTTTISPISYYERITCSAQWLDFNRSLAAELSAGLPPEENRRLFFRIGERVAKSLPVARCGTLAELQAAFNARWEAIAWGFATLEESAEQLTIVHACSPIAMAFGPESADWTAGFFEGAYQTWFAAQGSPAGLKVRAEAPDATGGLPTVILKLGRVAA